MTTGGKVFLTFGGVNMCMFLWRWDCARCLEFTRITSWPHDPHRDVTAVLKLLIKCFVQAQIYSCRTDIGSSIIFQHPYGNPYLFLWKRMENHCIWRLLGGGGFFLSIFLSSWLQLFFKWRCMVHGWNRCKHVRFEHSKLINAAAHRLNNAAKVDKVWNWHGPPGKSFCFWYVSKKQMAKRKIFFFKKRNQDGHLKGVSCLTEREPCREKRLNMWLNILENMQWSVYQHYLFPKQFVSSWLLLCGLFRPLTLFIATVCCSDQ